MKSHGSVMGTHFPVFILLPSCFFLYLVAHLLSCWPSLGGDRPHFPPFLIVTMFLVEHHQFFFFFCCKVWVSIS
ncbi:hypothetical protein IHE45_11G046400 [Dioscorea alata]|uniref:Uncharacterized protein n=1 Tax=Dioscorea alata TaxID=55571 RepID=A0ACB7V6N8_DIOAL|nr:hypothetical protein IHE45_11G046400 [Dioscorea alata]